MIYARSYRDVMAGSPAGGIIYPIAGMLLGYFVGKKVFKSREIAGIAIGGILGVVLFMSERQKYHVRMKNYLESTRPK